MLLLADIGNTLVKWAVSPSPGIVRAVAASGHADAAPMLRRLARRHSPTALAVASVVPKVARELSILARRCVPEVTHLDYRLFKTIMDIAVTPRMAPGADRLANAMALSTLCPLPACSVDAGTAITIEVVDADHRFIGGAIMPGSRLQFQALATGTAQLGCVAALPSSARAFGTTTASAIAAGVHVGIPGAVSAIIAGVERQLGRTLARIVITGGTGPALWSSLQLDWPCATLDPLLTFRGMAAAWHALARPHGALRRKP